MEDITKRLGDTVKDVMRLKGVNQRDLAKAANITEATVSRYLTGVHTPRIDYVVKIAGALGVSIDYLLGLSTSMTQDKPSPEAKALVAAYNRASAHVKKMVWMQLEEYLTPEERELANEQSIGQSVETA